MSICDRLVTPERVGIAPPAKEQKLKIALVSYVFSPDVGGITTVSLLLAREFAKRGHWVRVLTHSHGESSEKFPFAVIRRPAPGPLIENICWCDVLLNVHVSLRFSWPILLIRKPWVVAHHSWISRLDGSLGFVDYLKRFLLRRADCIAVSGALAGSLRTKSVVVGPPYDEETFRPNPSVARDLELIFVGRLVSSKGVDVLLDALAILRGRGIYPRLTIVGDGPEAPLLRKKTQSLQLAEQVRFEGLKTGPALRDMYCAHKIAVIPSITPETFGIVAIEAMACGCIVAGSKDAGGLAEAIGPGGVLFERRNPRSLADVLEQLLRASGPDANRREAIEAHLANFRIESIASRYLEVMQRAFAAASTRLLCFLTTSATIAM